MRVIISLLISALAFNAHAQLKYLTDKSQTEQLSKKVAELFAANKISEVIKELSPYWPLPQNEVDAFEEKTMKTMNMVIESYGSPIGTLKIKAETIADVSLRETYLVRFKITALRLKFTYYKNDNGWIVNAFKWDDSFTEEFK